jgi:hypothetical protein
LIVLHSLSYDADGSSSPQQLIDEAFRAGVEVLGITDHDTLTGYDLARDAAREAGVELICGIELSTKLHGKSVHLLGYFPLENGLETFRGWVLDQQASRRERNGRLAKRLRDLGLDVTLDEAEALGKGMTGRPHFAKLLVDKGYVANLRQAFDDYLDESAKGYVYRREPGFSEGVGAICQAGGIASLAHPIRVHEDVTALMPELCAAGLNALEAYHSDHGQAETELYLQLARRYGLLVTGGSDYHGTLKPDVRLGTGCDSNLRVPPEVVDALKAAAGA